MDQIFSRISLALSKHPAMTFTELARIVHDSFTPSNNVHQLERTWNVHPWLIGDEDCPVIATFWGDITDGQQFLIERCSHDMSGKPISTGVSLQVAEYSSGPYGPELCFWPSCCLRDCAALDGVLSWRLAKTLAEAVSLALPICSL